MYKITGADGKEYGPISAEQMRLWIAEGRVNAQTRVLAEGTTEWRLLGEFPEFAASIPTAPPPGMVSAAPMPSPVAQNMVNGPATGLMIVAILAFILQVVGIIFSLVGTSLFPNRQMDERAWANMMSGALGIVS